MVIEAQAHAKINLHLGVLNKRNDGLHNIFSLMASVELFDLLKLCSIEVHKNPGAGISVDLHNAGGINRDLLNSIAVKDNLIYRAACLYMKKAGLSGHIILAVEKNIPAGAGLGGGSSDAASVLRLLNNKIGAFKDEELSELGLSLGADVPYCLQGGFALCEGIGEIIEPVTSNLDCWIIIANNGTHIDTARAYKSLKRGKSISNDLPYESREFKKALLAGSLNDLKKICTNDFEGYVFKRYPDIGVIKERFYELSADFAIMTGSGASIVGFFSNYDRALEAQSVLRKDKTDTVITKFHA